MSLSKHSPQHKTVSLSATAPERLPREFIFSFRLAFTGPAGSGLAHVPPVTVYLFISKLEQHARGLGTRREDADKGRRSGGAQQTPFSGLKVALR